MILNFIIFFKSKRNSINKLINRLQNLEKKNPPSNSSYLSLCNTNENQHDEKNILSFIDQSTYSTRFLKHHSSRRSKEKHVSRYIHRYVFPLGSVERLIGCVSLPLSRESTLVAALVPERSRYPLHSHGPERVPYKYQRTRARPV